MEMLVPIYAMEVVIRFNSFSFKALPFHQLEITSVKMVVKILFTETSGKFRV